MNHIIKNDLNIFSFHDAEFVLKNHAQNKLVVSVRHLNVHKDSKENPLEYDMEIKSAVMTFDEVEIDYLEPMRGYKIGDNGNYYTDEEQIIYKDKEAKSRFIDELKKGISINCIDITTNESGRAVIEMSTCGRSPFFVGFSFCDVIIEWSEYLKKAWYELHRQYKHKVILETPTGNLETDMYIETHEEDMYYDDKNVKASPVSVSIKYNNEWIFGRGSDYLWADAFANLQKQLGDNVLLRCCITCRHGNFCPYGNDQEIVFCTKDTAINSKDDMCKLFDTPNLQDIKDRRKNVTNNCENYEPQSKEFYTYNDYLHYLLK